MISKRNIKDIADIQTGVYLKETPNGEAHYLQVKDFDKNALPVLSYPLPSIAEQQKIIAIAKLQKREQFLYKRIIELRNQLVNKQIIEILKNKK
ncbi:hypothetical protein Barb4_03978 [Bacteroidales bacterium Barb4]|nr:hypothetical protein Barb4_03978 [Bacteroidales bacterium Barb4]